MEKENIKSICCGNDVQKYGKTKYGKQNYLCLKCKKKFSFPDLVKKNEIQVRDELIKKLYTEDKLSTVQISKQIGLTNAMVGRILKKYDLIRSRSDARRLFKIETKLPVCEIIDLYVNKNMSSVKISKLLGCSKKSVLTILTKNNIERDNEYCYLNPKTDEIKSLYLSGKSLLEVSKLVGLSYTTVNTICKDLKIIRTEDRFGLGVDYNEWLKTIPIYRKYRSDVLKITSKQPIKRLPNYDKRGLAGVTGAYHLDHKYSILEGFKNDISPEIIGNIHNLEYIPWEENLSKKDKCSIIIEDLNIKIYGNSKIN